MMKKKYYVTSLCFLAILIGFIYVTYFSQFKLSPDALEYDSIGWNLANAQGYRIEQDVLDTTREPLYPLFLSMLYLCFGHNYAVVRVTQVVFYALICLLVYCISKEIYGKKIGIISLMAAILYPVFIVYCGYILTETLFTFLLILAIFCVIKALKSKLIGWYVISGFIFGVATLCKAVLILFPFFISFAVIYILGLKKKPLLSIFAMLFVFVVTVAPWTARNYKVSHSFIPVRTGLGFNLWWGSYLPWDGENLSGKGGYPEIRIKYIETEPLKSLVKGLTPGQADKVLTKEGIKNIKENPWGYLKLSLKRVVRLWAHPIGEELIKRYGIFFSIVLKLMHYIILLLSLIGMMFLLRDIKISMLGMPAIFAIVYFTFIYAATYAHPRYYFPVLPYVIIFSCAGLSGIINRLTIKRTAIREVI